jgi:acetolactate synthase II small subunit
MNHTLRIRLKNSEGAVLRALGLMERRGYQLESCKVAPVVGDEREMEVCVSSSRPGDLLKRQLDRLHDVAQVELQSSITREEPKSSIKQFSGAHK